MMTFFVTFAAMLITVSAMAIGVIFGRQSIKGSCGGLNNPELGGQCESCTCQTDTSSGIKIKI